MKYFFGLFIFIFLWSCKESVTLPKDRYVLEGIIENPGFDKFFASDVSALMTRPDVVFNPTTKGYIGDSIFTQQKGFYLGNYGETSFIYYAEPGADIRFRTDSKHFKEKLQFEADLAESNNFLTQTNRELEDTLKTLIEGVYSLNENEFLQKINSLQSLVDTIIHKNKSDKARPIIADFIRSNYQLELHNFIAQYPQAHAYETQNAQFKPSENFQNRMKQMPTIADSMVIYLPTYRKMLLSQFEVPLQEQIQLHQKELDAHTTSPVYLLLNTLQKDSTLSPLKKDYLIGTFATLFDYTPDNTMLQQVNDSLQQVVKNERVKTELQKAYNEITGLKKGSKAPSLSGKDKEGKTQTLSFNKPTLLYFYSTASADIDYSVEQLNSIHAQWKDTLQIVSINFDTHKDWSFFNKNITLPTLDLHEDQRFHSQVAKDYFIELAALNKVVLINEQGEIVQNNASELGSVEFQEQLNSVFGVQKK